jgi:DNA-binding NtrC family response regulator
VRSGANAPDPPRVALLHLIVGMTMPETMLDLLDHGCDGEPRWVTLHAKDAEEATRFERLIATEAERRGYMPVAADRVAALVRSTDDAVRHRTLAVLQQRDASAPPDGSALALAAGASPRPHVLVTIAVGERRPGTAVVREARTAYTVEPLRRGATWPPDTARYVARAEQAFALARRGRHAPAIRMLREASAALARRREAHPAAAAIILLGRVLLERGRAQEAAVAFADAAGLLDGSDAAGAALARVWVGLARTDAGQLTEAEGLLRATRLGGGLSDAVARRWADAALSRCLLWQDRGAEAAHLLDTPVHVDAAATPALVVPALATESRVRLAAGRLFEAGQRARAAVEWAARSTDPVLRLIAGIAHLRVIAAAGDLDLAADRQATLLAAAREHHLPLYALRVRLVWADMLRKAGRDREAARQAAVCARLAAAAPDLLKRRVRQAACGDAEAPRLTVTPADQGEYAVALLRAVQDEDDDRAAVRKALVRACDCLRAGRVDVQSAAAGALSTIASVGAGLASRLGQRALAAGIPVGPEQRDGAWQAATPVRMGQRVIGVVTARWPLGRDAASHAAAVLDLTATVVAPRLEVLLTARADAAKAAAAVPELIGESDAIAEVRRAIARAATAPFPVLIEGESGAGKELVARAVHHMSPRRDRRFCDVNCAALPDDLLEAELFGHAKGAFTGALVERRGLFEEASGGTLFLDELPDLSLRSQAKLLRAVQQGEIRRLGEGFSRRVDVRVIAATNRPMADEVTAGRFRQDLLYRLDVLRIRVPPLRDRAADIPALAQHLWEHASQRTGTRAVLSHAVLAELSRYHWPGNVRELQNVIAALAVSAPARGAVRASLLPAAITGAAGFTSGRLADARRQFERRFIEVALARAGGSRTRAAAQIGVTRQGLLKLMLRVGLNDARSDTRRV